MSKHLLMRPALTTEAQLLSGLAVRSKAYWGYSTAFMVACTEELSVSAQDIANASNDYWVGEVNGRLVGFFALENVSESTVELGALFVEPEYIGCGYGRRLMEAAKVLAAKQGATVLNIVSDPNAESFYLAVGAVRIGERASESIPGRYLPEFEIPVIITTT